jgi:predicted DNA repair protein MutK
MQAAALVAVALVITAGVYGFVALLVKLDDIGLHLTTRRRRTAQRVGGWLVKGVPYLLNALSGIGTAAMLWVGGGILVHGMEVLRFAAVPDAIHRAADRVAGGSGLLATLVNWVALAIGAALVGLVVGGILVGVVHLFQRVRGPAAAES